MTTVHAYTSSQQLMDGPSRDFRRGRAGAANMLPASTGAALATTKALPALAGKFDGFAIRVPIPVGSIADVTAVTTRPVTARRSTTPSRKKRAATAIGASSASPTTRSSPPTSSATRGPRWWTRR
jgi:glyceraldehyde 3-phosphate dehydrogenase (phosphorylating)